MCDPNETKWLVQICVWRCQLNQLWMVFSGKSCVCIQKRLLFFQSWWILYFPVCMSILFFEAKNYWDFTYFRCETRVQNPYHFNCYIRVLCRKKLYSLERIMLKISKIQWYTFEIKVFNKGCNNLVMFGSLLSKEKSQIT